MLTTTTRRILVAVLVTFAGAAVGTASLPGRATAQFEETCTESAEHSAIHWDKCRFHPTWVCICGGFSIDWCYTASVCP